MRNCIHTELHVEQFKLARAALGQPVEGVWTALTAMVLLMAVCGGISVKFFKWG